MGVYTKIKNNSNSKWNKSMRHSRIMMSRLIKQLAKENKSISHKQRKDQYWIKTILELETKKKDIVHHNLSSQENKNLNQDTHLLDHQAQNNQTLAKYHWEKQWGKKQWMILKRRRNVTKMTVMKRLRVALLTVCNHLYQNNLIQTIFYKKELKKWIPINK